MKAFKLGFLILLITCPVLLSAQEPQPTRVKAKALITDSLGNPVTSTVLPLGEVLYFSSEKATYAGTPESIRWLIDPPERSQRSQQIGKILVVPTGTAPTVIKITQIVTINDTLDIDTVSVIVGGKLPDPPKPDVPKPDIPKPDVPTINEELRQLLLTAPGVKKKEVGTMFKRLGESIKGRSIELSSLLKTTSDEFLTLLGTNALKDWVSVRDDLYDYLKKQPAGQLSDTYIAIGSYLETFNSYNPGK